MQSFAAKLASLVPSDAQPVGIVVVDHGSRRTESNELLLAVAELFRSRTEVTIVEPAHMELAEPDIATAYSRCVERGARTIVVFPYFLSPGRHWSEDIPRLAAEAAAKHPGVRHLVTAPLGLHEWIADVMAERITTCLQHQLHDGDACDLCGERAQCQLR